MEVATNQNGAIAVRSADWSTVRCRRQYLTKTIHGFTRATHASAVYNGPVPVSVSVTSRSSIETDERIELVLGTFKNNGTSSGTLAKTPDLENFATAYRSSKRVIKLSRQRWMLRADKVGRRRSTNS